MPVMLGTTELPFVPIMMLNFGIPPMQESRKAMADAAQATLEWLGAKGQVGVVQIGQLGLPAIMGGFTKAPFDYLGWYTWDYDGSFPVAAKSACCCGSPDPFGD